VDVDVERWAAIPEAPAYEVSSWGRVRRGDFLVATWPNKKGYFQVNLELPDGRPTLRAIAPLILTLFKGPRPSASHLCDHVDGIKAHNRVDNLEWVTSPESIRRAWRLGLMPRSRTPRLVCRRGHPLVRHGRRLRRCLVCRRAIKRLTREIQTGQVSLLSVLDPH